MFFSAVRFCGRMLGRAILPFLIGGLPAFGSIAFTDNTFNLASYSQISFLTTPNTANASIGASQSVLGNPGTALDVNVNWTVDSTFSAFIGLTNNGFTYNPASGSITSISFSVDRNVTFTPGTVVITNNAATLLLLQGGQYYVFTATGPAIVAGSYQTDSAAGLVATDFSLFNFSTGLPDATQHPNFSAAGGVITLGLRAGLGHNNALGAPAFFDSLYDNYSVTLTTVPEPQSSWSVLISLAVLAARARLSRLRC